MGRRALEEKYPCFLALQEDVCVIKGVEVSLAQCSFHRLIQGKASIKLGQ